MDFGTGLVALGFLLAAWTFIQNTKVRRAEWLMKLYEKFYENDDLKVVRRRLDYDKDGLLGDLATGNKDTVEKLSDYLNFFEFVQALRNIGQIEEREVREMFDYYIQLLRDPEVRRFCEEEGFENTLTLLDDFPTPRSSNV
jgi:hypothetical protein